METIKTRFAEWSDFTKEGVLAFIAQELTLLADKISAMSELTAPDRDRVEDFIRAHVKDLEE